MMEEAVMHRDRLSELSQSLIHHIFSFLSMRDVVSTTLLSKRWKNLWTTVPCLNFCETMKKDEYSGTDEGDMMEDEGNGTEDEDEDNGTDDEDEDEGNWTEDEDEHEDEVNRKKTERLQNFVNRVLLLWKGVKILKFKIDIKSDFGLSLAPDVNVWTAFAVKNKVQEFEIITSADYWAPQCLNSCSSITKISIVCCNFRIHGSPSWNHLKSLKIHVSCFSEDLLNRILLGSPVLEVLELQLVSNYVNINILSTSLKSLKIKNYSYFVDEKSLYTLRICCPNLETLEITGLFGKCLFTDISSLIDATFHFCNGYDDDDDDDCGSACLNELLGETLKQVFSSIQHVEKVALSDLCVQVFGASRKKYVLSPLPNVKFLKLALRHIEWGEMMDLLGIFPNLKILVIDHQSSTKPPVFSTVEFETNISKSFLPQLKIIEITASLPDFSIFGFIEFLLKHTVMLEKLVVWSREISSRQRKSLSKKLLSIPRSSPNAKVILKIKNK